MTEPRPTIAEIASACSALWDRARTLLITEPFDVEEAEALRIQVLASAEQARAANLDRSWKELRKAASDLEAHVKHTRTRRGNSGGRVEA